ncbi:hypothetical protein CPB85DRAFT_1250925 [Mucidula mucida]|nr:hypothetical protein CPB85DRAFT_1250925 [Mucidula mucida]
MTPHPAKQCRRTATTVMAGAFDRRPQRDVLTSLLNVGPDSYDDDEEENLVEASSSKLPVKDSFWRERWDGGKRKGKGKDRAADERPRQTPFSKSATPIARMTPLVSTQPLASTSYTSRPSINVVRSGRAASRTPSVSPESTPGPSDSSSISRTSSKRPRTPRDDEDFPMSLPRPAPPRKVQKTKRKGWKGWVEVDAEELAPSERLINLDQAVVLSERTLRSGKIFHGEPGSANWDDEVAP